MKKLTSILTAVILFSFFYSSIAQTKIEFKEVANMKSDRFGMGYTSDGEQIFAVGGGIGFDPFLSNSIESFDPKSGEWKILSKGLGRKRYCNAEHIPLNNKIYIFNGESMGSGFRAYSKRVEIFDVKTKQLTTLENNPYPVKSAGSVVYNNKIYVFGGQHINGVSDKFFEFDPLTNEWKSLTPMPKSKQTCGKVVGDLLYVIGGYDGAQMLKSVDVYDFKKNSWERIAELPKRVSAHALAVNGNDIWIIGAYDDNDYLACFNTVTKVTTEFENNMKGRRHAGAYVLNNVLYIFGGSKNSYNSSAMFSAEALDLVKINNN
ncbi:MAG: kelch repeat-containing protein [Ignavibacteria bacterium]|nr:MAG: kelch repeat-containing protein [Ignavibacteria bacterium]KAF0160362.1 MAG: kelch repeat-containing protein [Ignavibacteria bacterium]